MGSRVVLLEGAGLVPRCSWNSMKHLSNQSLAAPQVWPQPRRSLESSSRSFQRSWKSDSHSVGAATASRSCRLVSDPIRMILAATLVAVVQCRAGASLHTFRRTPSRMLASSNNKEVCLHPEPASGGTVGQVLSVSLARLMLLDGKWIMSSAPM